MTSLKIDKQFIYFSMMLSVVLCSCKKNYLHEMHGVWDITTYTLSTYDTASASFKPDTSIDNLGFMYLWDQLSDEENDCYYDSMDVKIKPLWVSELEYFTNAQGSCFWFADKHRITFWYNAGLNYHYMVITTEKTAKNSYKWTYFSNNRKEEFSVNKSKN